MDKKGLMYRGQFASRDEKEYAVELYRDGYSGDVGDLSFRSESPLLIEWPETDKEEPLQGSTATLGLLSPGDMTYADLYTTKACSVVMDVYREGELWWSGTLDAEQYEEPYTDVADYEVELTFSDFGPLERLKWSGKGLATLREITEDAVKRLGLHTVGIREDLISTKMNAGDEGHISLKDISVRGDNFYSDEGEAKDMHEVMEGILQPLGLRMIQRCGYIHIYDINGLNGSEATETVRWASDDQRFSADKAVNDVKITFSPHASATISDKIRYYEAKDQEKTDIHGTDHWSDGWDAENISLRMLTRKSGSGIAYLNTEKGKYFKTVPLLGGADEQGVAELFSTVVKGADGKLYVEAHGATATVSTAMDAANNTSVAADTGQILLRSRKMWLPKMEEDEALKYKIRVKIAMLADARWNPWDEADSDNREKELNKLRSLYNAAYLETRVRLYDESGALSKAWDNTGAYSAKQVLRLIQGKWIEGDEAQSALCRIEYYDKDDPYDGCAIGGGFASNRPAMGSRGAETGNKEKARLGAWMKKADDGEYISYPASGGYLEITVMSGLSGSTWVHKKGHNNNYWRTLTAEDGDYKTITWLLVKAPEVTIVKDGLKTTDAESDDIEYTGKIDENAKEELKIDTICGTMGTPLPTAKGIYYDSATALPLKSLTRAGITDIPEHLLIGTLCSQYGSRKIKLTGTATLLNGTWGALKEALTGEKKYIYSGGEENPGEGTADITVTEIAGDEYKGKSGEQ